MVIDGRMQIEGLASDLIQRGMVEKCNLPELRGPQTVRSNVDGHSICAIRLRRNLVCVIMPVEFALKRDKGFARLMAGLSMFMD